MTTLRKKMIDDMQLHGLTKNTQGQYIGAVNKLAKYYNISPDKLSQDDIRNFFLYLITKKNISHGGFSTYLSGIKFFYEKTLGCNWNELKIIRPKKRKKLPIILATEEVKMILDKVKKPSYKMCLTMIYCCGLRVSEGVRLNVADIDSKRMMVRINDSKNGKDRYVPLTIKTLKLLRKYWKEYRPYPWLFPSRQQKIVTRGNLYRVFKLALKESGIKKDVSIHNLRHSFATHLMENGVKITAIQVILGHTNPKTTSIYLHLTKKIEEEMSAALNDIIDQL